MGSHGRAWLGYSYNDVTFTGQSFGTARPPDAPLTDSRPHTLVGAVLYQTGSGARFLGGVLRNSGLYGTFRVATGTAYTACPATNPFDAGVLSGELCTRAFAGGINGARLPVTKVLDLKHTRSFPVGGTTIAAFANARNLFNWRSVTRVFAQTGKTSNPEDRAQNRASDFDQWAREAERNGVLQGDSTVDLTFGGAQDPRTGCGGWLDSNGADVTPNCVYLIRAEERFGNGDHRFTRAEQTRASDAFYLVARGLQNFTSTGRRVRVGMEVRF